MFSDFLEAATTLKAGYLAPVELIAPAHLGIHLTAKCIVNYRTRLLSPKDSKKPKALLIPSFDAKRKLRRFPHMLPAVARTIIREFDIIAQLYTETEDNECTQDDLTKHSPSKVALKEKNFVLLEKVASLEGRVSELTAEAAQNPRYPMWVWGGTQFLYGKRYGMYSI